MVDIIEAEFSCPLLMGIIAIPRGWLESSHCRRQNKTLANNWITRHITHICHRSFIIHRRLNFTENLKFEANWKEKRKMKQNFFRSFSLRSRVYLLPVGDRRWSFLFSFCSAMAQEMSRRQSSSFVYRTNENFLGKKFSSRVFPLVVFLVFVFLCFCCALLGCHLKSSKSGR